MWAQARHLILLYLGSICIKQEWKYELCPTPVLSHLFHSHFSRQGQCLFACMQPTAHQGSDLRQGPEALAGSGNITADGARAQLWAIPDAAARMLVEPTAAVFSWDQTQQLGTMSGFAIRYVGLYSLGPRLYLGLVFVHLWRVYSATGTVLELVHCGIYPAASKV